MPLDIGDEELGAIRRYLDRSRIPPGWNEAGDFATGVLFRPLQVVNKGTEPNFCDTIIGAVGDIECLPGWIEGQGIAAATKRQTRHRAARNCLQQLAIVGSNDRHSIAVGVGYVKISALRRCMVLNLWT